MQEITVKVEKYLLTSNLHILSIVTNILGVQKSSEF